MSETMKALLQSPLGVRVRLAWRLVERLPANVRGIAAMLVAMAAFALGDAIMKVQADRMPLGQSIFLRGVIVCSLVAALLRQVGLMPSLADLQNRFLLWRSLGDSAASFFYIAALGRVPLADAGAIMQTNPLAVTAGAALFLGERVGWRRWTATAVGFFGALLIIQPGSKGFSWASLLVIGAVLTSAGRDLITRRLDGFSPLVVAGSAALSTTILSVGLAPFETWIRPTILDALRLVLASLCLILAQVLVVISIRSGDVSAVVPFRYSAILWTLLLSMIIWGYVPNGLTLSGIAIVSGAGLYAFYREQSLRRQGKLA